MYNSTLKVKKSLRQSYMDKVRSGEKEYKPLKCNTSLQQSYNNKVKNGDCKKYQYKPKAKTYSKSSFSIYGDLNVCNITGSREDIHVHHIFGSSNKANSEQYGFLVGLRSDWHDLADYGVHFNKELDLKYKRECQEYWLNTYGTKEEFIRRFGKWW